MTDKSQNKKELTSDEKRITDVELSKKLSYAIYENYQTALELINFSPKSSLSSFRIVVEHIIDVIADKHKLDTELKGKNIEDSIDYLFDCQIINNKHLKGNFHKVRKFGNIGPHKSPSFNDKDNEFDKDKKEFYKKTKSRLIEKAKNARKILISIFGDVYLMMNKGKSLPDITLTPIGHNREIIYNALVSTNYKDKLKAGIICEYMLEEQLHSSEIFEQGNTEYHFKGLRKIALSFYESAYKISAQVDNKSYSSDKEKEVEIFKKCELEPLYKYASFGLSNDNDKNYEKFKKALQMAADRGYTSAKALFGAVLYEKKDFKKAFEYLSKAERKNECLALRFLYYYYTEGLASKIKPKKALKYLNRAIDLGDPDSFATLGEAYHEGRHLLKDDKRAKELLKKSVELGSTFGKTVLFGFNNTPEKYEEYINIRLRNL
jgi:hypothetical protein